jgi:hypothetical protein
MKYISRVVAAQIAPMASLQVSSRIKACNEREIPCISLISPQFDLRDISHLCEFFMFP